jgi:hypothetical protein
MVFLLSRIMEIMLRLFIEATSEIFQGVISQAALFEDGVFTSNSSPSAFMNPPR